MTYLTTKLYFNYLLIYVLYIIVAYFSVGYYNPDEHYQLIEFAGLKLGWNSVADMPWEYRTMIRPALQPYICMLLFKFLNGIGLRDPYHLAFALRLLTASLSFMCINFFYKTSRKFLRPEWHIPYFYLSFLLWFIPFVSVRFSSETWAGLSFLTGLGFLFSSGSKNRPYYFAGICFGASFVFRFQSAFLIIGLISWLIYYRKADLSSILKLGVSMILTMLAGVVIDSIFYGKFTLSFVNYFKVNIVSGVASEYGVSPWYEYLSDTLLFPVWPVGLLILTSVIFLLIRQSKNVFLWCIMPFFVVHSIIPHKELRFLFPLAWLTPVLIITAVQTFEDQLRGKSFDAIWQQLKPVTALVLLIINIIALAVIAVTPAGNGEKSVSLFLRNTFPNQKVRLFYTRFANPMAPIPKLRENFYRNDAIKTHYIETSGQLTSISFSPDSVTLIAVTKYDQELLGNLLDFKNLKMVPITQSIPKIAESLMTLTPPFATKSTIVIYKMLP